MFPACLNVLMALGKGHLFPEVGSALAPPEGSHFG